MATKPHSGPDSVTGLLIFGGLLTLIFALWLHGDFDKPREWHGPQGDFQSNMQQTGVNDVQWPLYLRQEYARQHGLAEPKR